MKKRTLTILIAVVLVVACAVGGTLAWLADKSGPVTNTFTVGDINIELTETWNTDSNGDGEFDSWQAQLVPGMELAKDPEVTVDANSEKCYLFVKVDESNWPQFKEADNSTLKVKYTLANGWTKLENGVYYRIVDASSDNQAFTVLLNDKVYVSQTLTKTELNQITTNPTLTFTAYAVQYMKNNTESFTPAEAWTNAQAAASN